jgi:hypothetical protein
MAAAGHTFPNYTQLLTAKSASVSALQGSTSLVAMLIASSSPALAFNATSEAFTTVTSLLAGSGAGALTEVSGGGYTRISLGTVACSTSGLVTTLTCAPLVWTSSTISATYLVIYDATVNTNDGTRVVLAYQDFGGTEADTAGTFTFTPASNVIATWTAS